MDDKSVPAIKQVDAKGIVCVTLDVHLWSGRKRLRKEALIEKNPKLSDLPPESLATMGSIKIADPDDLAPFLRYKREAEKLLKLHGLPLLGTIGIPEAKLQKVYQGLKGIQSKFMAKRDALYNNFSARISDWRLKEENADWAHLITDIPPPEYVAGKLSFGFHLCRAQPPSDLDEELNRQFNSQMSGMRGTLFNEAAAEARLMLENYLWGKQADGAVRKRSKITPKTLGPLRRVAEKFTSFGFLDHTVEPVADMVNHVLSLMPDEGPIEGVLLTHVWTLCKILSNPDSADEAAKVALQKDSAAEAFEVYASTAPDLIDSPAVETPMHTRKDEQAGDEDNTGANTPVDDLMVPATKPSYIDTSFEPNFNGLF